MTSLTNALKKQFYVCVLLYSIFILVLCYMLYCCNIRDEKNMLDWLTNKGEQHIQSKAKTVTKTQLNGG